MEEVTQKGSSISLGVLYSYIWTGHKCLIHATHSMVSVGRFTRQRGSNYFITYEGKLIWNESEEGSEEERNDYDDAEGSSVSLGVVTAF